MTIPCRSSFLSFCLLAGATVSAAAAEGKTPITLLYNDRPPYAMSQPDGSVEGLTATPVARAFRTAGLSFAWVNVPTNRQLSLVREATGMLCGLGWFRNPGREHFAKFTVAIYQDKPTVVLANKAFTADQGSTLAEVLARPGTRVLVKDNYSYGAYIDRLMASMEPVVVKTTGENRKMAQMLLANRADFMFMAEEEAGYLVAGSAADSAGLHVVRFAEMPSGEKRYLMCSKKVPDEYIARLNKALAGN